jgi:hypothetical protein
MILNMHSMTITSPSLPPASLRLSGPSRLHSRSYLLLRHGLQAAVVALFVWVMGGSILAATVYSTGFESPTYTAGAVAGQDGWSQDIGATSSITVQSATVKTGTQAVQFNPTGQPNFTRVYRFPFFDTSASAEKLVILSADVFISSAGNPSEFRISAFNANGDSLPFVRILQNGLLNVSAVLTNVTVTKDVWHHYELRFDFVNYKMGVVYDGVWVASGIAFSSASPIYSTFAVEVLPGGSGTSPVFLDNVSVTSAVVTVPEIAVSEAGVGNIADGGSFSFGTTTVGTPVTKTFTVTNTGAGTLNLFGLAVPSGFSIAQSFGSSAVVSGGGTTTFKITQNAAAVSSPSGTLTFSNDDLDENPFNFTISGTVTPAPVAIASLNRVGATPSNAASVSWTLTFASAVTGVTASNFSLTGAGATGASVGTPTTANGGLSWTVPVTTGNDGTLTLNLANSTGLSAPISTSLPYAGESYTIDKTPPHVVSVTRQNPAGQATSSTTLIFRVTYSEPVTLDAPETSHFQLVAVNGSNVIGTVTGVAGSGSTRDVTVNITSGTGEFRLRVVD